MRHTSLRDSRSSAHAITPARTTTSVHPEILMAAYAAAVRRGCSREHPACAGPVAAGLAARPTPGRSPPAWMRGSDIEGCRHHGCCAGIAPRCHVRPTAVLLRRHPPQSPAAAESANEDELCAERGDRMPALPYISGNWYCPCSCTRSTSPAGRCGLRAFAGSTSSSPRRRATLTRGRTGFAGAGNDASTPGKPSRPGQACDSESGWWGAYATGRPGCRCGQDRSISEGNMT